jgi:hypothetical protein
MANTVSLLSYSSTFGDWFNTTNQLVLENNNLAANSYTKSTGTLFLNAPSLGLQVANNAIFNGYFQVNGIGSEAYVQNDLQVDGNIYANNIVVSNNIVLTGTTIFNSNNFTLNANNLIGANSTIVVNRGSSGANATILWNEPAKSWQILDVTNSKYYNILTTENIVSGGSF